MSTIVCCHIWDCEFCDTQLYDKAEMIRHLKEKHDVDVDSPRANSGMIGDNLIVSDLVIPEGLEDDWGKPKMGFNEYQQKALSTAIYLNIGKCLYYPTLGLTGEAGEVAEKVKKMYRDDAGILTDARKQDIKKELGDVLWYVAMVAFECGIQLDDVAQFNVEKLQVRKTNNAIHGSGDNR